MMNFVKIDRITCNWLCIHDDMIEWINDDSVFNMLNVMMWLDVCLLCEM